MAIEIISSEEKFNGNGSQALTVPAECDFLLLMHTDQLTQVPTNVTWNGDAVGVIVSPPDEAGKHIWFGIASPDIGTHNLLWTPNGLAHGWFVIYLKGVKRVDYLLDVDSGRGVNDKNFILTSEVGGMCFMGASTPDGSDPYPYSATFGATLLHNATHATPPNGTDHAIAYKPVDDVTCQLGINGSGSDNVSFSGFSLAPVSRGLKASPIFFN